MSANCFSAFAVRSLVTFSLGLFALGPTPSAAIDCTSSLPLTPGKSWRDPGEASGSACFTVDLDSAGALVIELVQPATAPRAYLALVNADAAGAAVLQHSATTLVVAATSGSYRVRVATADPDEALEPFQLRVDLAESGAKGERDSEIELEPNPFAGGGCPDKDERDSEIEIEPNPFAGGGCSEKNERDSEIEIEPNPFAGGGCSEKDEDDSELEIEPNPLLAPSVAVSADLTAIPGLGQQELAQLCQQSRRDERRDDQADTFLCASPLHLERPVKGRIDNGWGDDSDVYRFTVTSVRPVEIRTQLGERSGDLVVELYDRYGQQLDAILANESPSLVQTLVPGAYFVRLTGLDGAVGEYALRVGSPQR